MSIFYCIVNVSTNNLADKVTNNIHNIKAYTWVDAFGPEDAKAKNIFYLNRSGFSIETTFLAPVEVNEIDFFGKDIGLDGFRKAKKYGHAIVIVGVSSIVTSSESPIELGVQRTLDLQTTLKTIERFKEKGRCLHFDAGVRCNSPINAHSIQRKGLLSLIQEEGHVYCPSFTYSSKKLNRDIVRYEKKGIKKVSTFLGFCSIHDKELFHPIDDSFLIPTDEQVVLYSYRSLCREYFVKENAINSYAKLIEFEKLNTAIIDMMKNMKAGFELGFRDLSYHKNKYDEMLKSKNFSDIQYVLFLSEERPNIVFSGLLYPHYDFVGGKLQDIGNSRIGMRLLTFCSAPTEKGWDFLISWIKYNDDICIPFVESLKEAVRNGERLQDCLFRLLLLCENHAVSPKWWQSLGDDQKEEIQKRLSFYCDVFTGIDSDELAKGVNSICEWNFDKVIEVIR